MIAWGGGGSTGREVWSTSCSFHLFVCFVSLYLPPSGLNKGFDWLREAAALPSSRKDEMKLKHFRGENKQTSFTQVSSRLRRRRPNPT